MGLPARRAGRPFGSPPPPGPRRRPPFPGRASGRGRRGWGDARGPEMPRGRARPPPGKGPPVLAPKAEGFRRPPSPVGGGASGGGAGPAPAPPLGGKGALSAACPGRLRRDDRRLSPGAPGRSGGREEGKWEWEKTERCPPPPGAPRAAGGERIGAGGNPARPLKRPEGAERAGPGGTGGYPRIIRPPPGAAQQAAPRRLPHGERAGGGGRGQGSPASPLPGTPGRVRRGRRRPQGRCARDRATAAGGPARDLRSLAPPGEEPPPNINERAGGPARSNKTKQNKKGGRHV